MTEERRAAIEREIENLKYGRKVLRKLYYKLDGVAPEVVLSDIVSDIYLLEDRIVRLRTEKQLIEKAREEALCEAADKTLQEYADIADGRILIDEDNVAHVNGTIETPRMVIEAALRRTGRMFKSWLCNPFKGVGE